MSCINKRAVASKRGGEEIHQGESIDERRTIG